MKTKIVGASLAVIMTLAIAAYSILGNVGAVDYWSVYFVPDLTGSVLGAILGSLVVVLLVRRQRPVGTGVLVPLVFAVAVFAFVNATSRVVAGVSTYGDEFSAAFLPIFGTAWIAAYVYLIGGGLVYAMQGSDTAQRVDQQHLSRSI